jgi:hypothetical protein
MNSSDKELIGKIVFVNKAKYRIISKISEGKSLYPYSSLLTSNLYLQNDKISICLKSLIIFLMISVHS